MRTRGELRYEAEYLSNEEMRVMCERKFEIIGEALSALRKRADVANPTIRHSAEAIDLRHVLVHGYAAIDHSIIWNAYQKYLPERVADVRAALEASS